MPSKSALVEDREMADVSGAFRSAMRRLTSAVGVVTALRDGVRIGMTASSITSVTLNPPALLVCVNRSARLHACLGEAAPFCVNLLSAAQREVSIAFAGGLSADARFGLGLWSTDARGVSRLDGAQANISCVVERAIPYGTHEILIGRVEAVRIAGAVDPLIYQDGRYLSGWTLSASAISDML
jgi:flavin reductase (DIM6/NTAB) family NADH-FMN oxidoreductase RutF